MGKASRNRPKYLATKLVQIRTALNLSQNGMIRHLQLEDELTQAEISAFERGVREPPSPTLLRYAKVAGIYVDDLIDDEVNLPEKLPANRRKR